MPSPGTRNVSATGDLADCWLELEAKQRSLHSSLHVLAEWSPLAAGGLDGFDLAEHPTALFRLDSFTVTGPVADAVGCGRSTVPSAIRRRDRVDHRVLVAISRRPRRARRERAQPGRVRRSGARRVFETHRALERCARAPRGAPPHPAAPQRVLVARRLTIRQSAAGPLPSRSATCGAR